MCWFGDELTIGLNSLQTNNIELNFIVLKFEKLLLLEKKILKSLEFSDLIQRALCAK